MMAGPNESVADVIHRQGVHIGKLKAEIEELRQRNVTLAEQFRLMGTVRAERREFLERAEKTETERARLDALINNPHTADFLESIRTEAAHQRERWG